ncbi:MAG: VPLPA-CTERM sorting domain-containing protein [Gammaproteobacteria bacterium]
MRIKNLQSSLIFTLSLLGMFITQSGFASELVIDNFDDFQIVKDRGNSVGSTVDVQTGVTGTRLQNVTRTLIARATEGMAAAKTEIRSQNQLLSISNSIFSSGTASISWDFDPENFTQLGNAFSLEAVSLDQNVLAEITINGNTSSGNKMLDGLGNFVVGFDDFSDKNQFTNVSSLQLNFSGQRAWDGQFRLSVTSIPRTLELSSTVPLPATVWTFLGGLVGLMGIHRRKHKSN